jgi:hypothetical protein
MPRRMNGESSVIAHQAWINFNEIVHERAPLINCPDKQSACTPHSRCRGVNGIPKIIPQPHPDIRPRAVTRTPRRASEVRVRTVSVFERNATAIRMKTMKERKISFMSC